MTLPRTISPQAGATQEARRLEYQKSVAVGGYARRREFARRAFRDYVTSRSQADLDFANDWIEAANRAVRDAAEFGVALVGLAKYAPWPAIPAQL